MKKILAIIILFSTFTGAFAGSKLYKGEAKILESQFTFNYGNPKIGDITLKDLDYDLKFYTNGALLEVEIETFSGDGGWSKLKKEDIDIFFYKLAREIRTTVNNPDLPVNIIVEVEREFGDDITVLNKLY